MPSELDKTVAVISDLPSIPAIANRVMSAVGDDSTSADDLREILEADPSLSARVLRVANSSLYGFPRAVETLRHAITLLGFKQVECLVMAASLRDVFSHFGLSEKLMWEHATAAGVAAGRLASYGAIDVPRESAFTAGLLHDIGKVAFSNVYRERYARVISRVYNEDISWVEAESAEFGFDHATLGALVAEKWTLPPNLVHAIRHHHHEPSEYEPGEPVLARLTALVTVVTTTLTMLGVGRRGGSDGLNPCSLGAWQLLGLTEDDRETVIEIVTEESKSALELFA